MRSNFVEYIKKNLKKGYTLDSLKYALISQGYPRTTVELAVNQVTKELAQKAPILKEKPKITYQLIDENNRLVNIKKNWWKKLLGL